MLSRTQRELRATEDKIVELADNAKAVMDRADSEGRTRTGEENAEMAELHKSIEKLRTNARELEEQVDLEKQVNEAAGKISEPKEDADTKGLIPLLNGLASVTVPQREETFGEMFVNTEQFKRIHAQVKSGGGQFSTGAIDIALTKGTLLETAAGGGAGAIPVPQVLPGQVDKLFQRLTVSDLILTGQASTNSLRYVVEGTATSGAAGVAEGGTKPQSTFGLTTRDEPVKKIATLTKISSEMLEDVSQVRAYLDGRLSLFVRIEEERQLVRGAGTNEIVGIMDSTRAINIYAGGTAAGNKAVQLFKAMNGQRGSALVEPDFVVMHPTDWQDVRLLTDTAGQFFGGGPFQGPYGNGQVFSASGLATGAQDTIWNKPVVVTTALGGAGTALIGTSSAAQLFRRGGVTVEATNSNDTDFEKNLVSIRAEQRQALAVYRPTAFTEVRLA